MIIKDRKKNYTMVKYGETFYGRHLALTTIVMKIRRFSKKCSLRAMKISTKPKSTETPSRLGQTNLDSKTLLQEGLSEQNFLAT